MSLRGWAEAFAALEPADSEWDWRGRREEFCERIGELAAVSTALGLSEAQWDRVAETAAFTSASILWDEEESIDFRLKLLESLAALVRKVIPLTPTRQYGTRMFWDVIAIRGRPVDPTALPHLAIDRNYQAPEVADALYQTLSRQLEVPDKRAQLSALQGLSQLGDSRTSALIRSVRANLVDAEVRAAASRAASFELM